MVSPAYDVIVTKCRRWCRPTYPNNNCDCF